MEYFKFSINDKLFEVKIGAAYNLPCFYFTYNNQDEGDQNYFQHLYLDLSKDQNIEIIQVAASGFHEILGLISKDSTLGLFKDCLKEFMNSKHSIVREQIIENLDKIIENYAKEQDIKDLYESLQFQAQNQAEQTLNMQSCQREPRNQKNFQFQTDEIQRLGTGNKNSKYQFPRRVSDGDYLEYKPQYQIKLQEYLEYDLIPEDKQYELLYSQLLEDINYIYQNIEISSWRQMHTFIINFASQINCFNSVELQNIFFQKFLELMLISNDHLRKSISFWIAKLFQIQYNSFKRKELSDKLNEFGKSTSSVYRRCFISFCIQGIQVLPFRKFKEHFLDSYMSMANDKVTEVKIQFLNSALLVRPYIEQDLDLLLKFNNYLSMLRVQENQFIANIAVKVDQQLLKNKTNQNANNDANEKKKLVQEQKLQQREKQEEEERKKKDEEKEEIKFDYQTLLANTTKKYNNFKKGLNMNFKSQIHKKSINQIINPNSTKHQYHSPVITIPKNNQQGSTMAIMENNAKTINQYNVSNFNSNDANSQLRKKSNFMIGTSGQQQNSNQLLPPIQSPNIPKNQRKSEIFSSRKIKLQ